MTIKLRNKKCIICGREDKPWFSKKRCKSCASKSYSKSTVKHTPIPKQSAKRKVDNVQYLKLRLEFLNKNQKCQMNCSGECTEFATDVHHLYSGKDRNKYFLVVETWMASCRQCHDWVHYFSKEAREIRLLK